MRLWLENLEAVTLERKRTDDCGIHCRCMRKRWAPKPRSDLAHSHTAAHAIGPFEDKGLQARLRKKRRRDETAVTGTDDDDVAAHWA